MNEFRFICARLILYERVLKRWAILLGNKAYKNITSVVKMILFSLEKFKYGKNVIFEKNRLR
mgnify:FL=1